MVTQSGRGELSVFAVDGLKERCLVFLVKRVIFPRGIREELTVPCEGDGENTVSVVLNRRPAEKVI